MLVIKDDVHGFVGLTPCKTASAEETYGVLKAWFSRYRLCKTWDTDRGSDFKNKLIESCPYMDGAYHHFATEYCLWANGTVEVVNRVL